MGSETRDSQNFNVGVMVFYSGSLARPRFELKKSKCKVHTGSDKREVRSKKVLTGEPPVKGWFGGQARFAVGKSGDAKVILSHDFLTK